VAAESWRTGDTPGSIGFVGGCRYILSPSTFTVQFSTAIRLFVGCGDAGTPESCGIAITTVLSSLPLVLSSPPSTEKLFPSRGASTGAWNGFPEALGRGAWSWRCLGGISRCGVSEIA
jgi:hypothetical protein